MQPATLTLSSKTYSSWSMRGWLMCRIAGIDFIEQIQPIDDPNTRAELLLLSPSFLVPALTMDGIRIWDTLAIGETLAEWFPESGLLPKDRAVRAHCRSVAGEMHTGFYNLRSALPMNLKAHYPGFKVWAGAQGDIQRVTEIWRDCFGRYGGPFLFGNAPTMADAMYAPVCTRFITYDVKLDPACVRYCETIRTWGPVVEWYQGAAGEPDEIEELDAEF
jgi:glutathione S-transferase